MFRVSWYPGMSPTDRLAGGPESALGREPRLPPELLAGLRRVEDHRLPDELGLSERRRERRQARDHAQRSRHRGPRKRQRPDTELAQRLPTGDDARSGQVVGAGWTVPAHGDRQRLGDVVL